MQQPFHTVLDELRAVAEPSRLRLLSILSGGEFSVTELTEVLAQSQPRVSRHLKLLDDAGLLERFREQHWIYYRVPADGVGARLARLLLDQVDPEDAVLVGDRERVQRVLAARHGKEGSGDAAAEPPADELIPQVAAELGAGEVDALLYFGRDPARLLAGVGACARRVVGMNASRHVVQRARAVLHSSGLGDCLLQQGELTALPQPADSFDVVVVDRVLATGDRPDRCLQEAARVLRPGGRLLVLEDFEALERRTKQANPLAVLRSWLADAGYACDRLRPIDLSGAHLLLAVATPPDAAAAA